jgi:hypothetical protein
VGKKTQTRKCGQRLRPANSNIGTTIKDQVFEYNEIDCMLFERVLEQGNVVMLNFGRSNNSLSLREVKDKTYKYESVKYPDIKGKGGRKRGNVCGSEWLSAGNGKTARRRYGGDQSQHDEYCPRQSAAAV